MTMKCLAPVRRGSHRAPCGQCRNCVRNAAGEELVLAMLEVATSDVAFRLDQTFRDEPSLSDGRKAIGEWLRTLQQRFGVGSLRYLAAAEYGTKGGRLHFHILLCFSGEKASAVTVRAVRAEGRTKFGFNTARLLKRPLDKRSPKARAAIVGYAVKQVVQYALKGSKQSAPPFLRDAEGKPVLGKDGRKLRERVLRFTRSQSWGKRAAEKVLATPLMAAVIHEFEQAGERLIFRSMREADGSRYWLPASKNPLPPSKHPGLEYIPEFAPDLSPEDRDAIAGNPVSEGYALGERFSVDPETAISARYAHGRPSVPPKAKAVDGSTPDLFPPAVPPRSVDYIARLLDPAPSEDADHDGSDEHDADLGPAPVSRSDRKASRHPPASYASLAREQEEKRYQARYLKPDDRLQALVDRWKADLAQGKDYTPGAFASMMHISNTDAWLAHREVHRIVEKPRPAQRPVTNMPPAVQDIWAEREQLRARIAARHGVSTTDVRWNGTEFEVDADARRIVQPKTNAPAKAEGARGKRPPPFHFMKNSKKTNN